MCPLCAVKGAAAAPARYGRAVRAWPALFFALLATPGWTGEARLSLPERAARVTATRVALRPGDPAVRRTGGLTYLGGVALRSADPAFGSFSALIVEGDRFTLMSDGGVAARFRMGADWTPRDVRFDALPAGPGTGWTKTDRDAEAMTIDPRTGRVWVAFENHDEIWRYAPGLTRGERGRAPRAMANWPTNGGAESMTRLRDGRFVVIAEKRRPPRKSREKPERARAALLFAGDPTDPRVRVDAFIYRPAPAHDPTDIVELPGGRLLVLERAFAFPWRWRTRVALVERGAVRAGAVVTGRTLARLDAPMLADNFEGIAAATEGGATIVWLLSDDNQFPLQRTLLLKFRLEY